MKLSLIGMSGSGKSHWSAKLVERGFRRFCCDDLIEKKLKSHLLRPDGTMMDMGQWMGFPYEPHYEERAAKYLTYEVEILTEIVEQLKDLDEDVVVDTTGSFIYTGEMIISKLRQQTVLVHLATPPEVRDEMLEKYLDNQRPVLWDSIFHQEPGETNEAALVRCYPALLSSRERLYAQYANVEIDYYSRHRDDFGVDDFLRRVRIR